MRRPILCLALSALLMGCASSPPAQQPIAAPVLTPGSGEAVTLDQLVVLVDASASLPEGSFYRDQKTLVESVLRTIPDGDYETATINFGGYARQSTELSATSRQGLVSEAESLSHLDEGTPIHKALDEAAAQLQSRSGRAAVLLFSDGELTDEVGRDLDGQVALDAAEGIAEVYDGELCIHTVQTGPSASGAALLERLSRVTGCGSFRPAERIDNVASLHQFERDVFIGALPAVAAAPGDADGDGVIDSRDACPGTPAGAHVDVRGCWQARNLLFDTDSAAIDGEGEESLDEVVELLRENPGLRVSVDGYTDARGADAYNEKLSERRARAARDYLVQQGIAADRLEARGLGESNPVAPNDGPEGWRLNRRTELTVLD